MKKIVRNVVRYRCDICNTRYQRAKEALACEALPIEIQTFLSGAKVTWREKRICSKFGGRLYSLQGTVRHIHGPTRADEEYNCKWLGGQLSNKHVYQYEVEWICPHCRQERSGLFYGMELVRL